MSREKYNIIQFTVALIAEFALRFGISQRQALNYLVRFKGMDHLENHYDILHTFSFEDTIDSLAQVCRNNGGQLA